MNEINELDNWLHNTETATMTTIKQASSHWDDFGKRADMFNDEPRLFSWYIYLSFFMAEHFVAAAVVFHVICIKERSILSHHWKNWHRCDL